MTRAARELAARARQQRAALAAAGCADPDGAALAAAVGEAASGPDLEDDGPWHPWFEALLRAYSAGQRKRHGVYLTPRPVADFLVRSTHHFLQTEFGLADGLADTATWGAMARRWPGLEPPPGTPPEAPFVRVVDPAAGTGVFLLAAIDWARGYLGPRWPAFLAARGADWLTGVEVLPAAAALARALLAARGVPARVEVASSLEPLPLWTSGPPFTVVLGNPPYAGLSRNNHPWIDGLLRGRLPDGTAVSGYYTADGRPLGERKLWLQDDYVKFFRLGQWLIERAGAGVLAYVTNHAYLDNPTFRGLRQQLLTAFPAAAVADLNGSARRREEGADANLFAIEQGVALGAFRRPPGLTAGINPAARPCGDEPPGSSRRSGLYYGAVRGTRPEKIAWLERQDLAAAADQSLTPAAPFYFFVPRREDHRAEYEAAIPLPQVMPVFVAGVITARDHLVYDFDRQALLDRLALLRSEEPTDAHLRARFFPGRGNDRYAAGDTRGWKLPDARRRLRDDPDWQGRVTSVAYRPFDLRHLYYAAGMVDWPRAEVMRHFAGGNLGLVTCRQCVGPDWRHVLVTDRVTDDCYVSNRTRERGYVFPLYLTDGGARRANLAPAFSTELAEALGLAWQPLGAGDLRPGGTVGPEDVFHYLYAQLHSPRYRSRYGEFLRSDWPRVFRPQGVDELREWGRLGAELVGLHLPGGGEPHPPDPPPLSGEGGESPEPGNRTAASPPAPSPRLGEGAGGERLNLPRYHDGRVTVGPGLVLEGVAQEVWDFALGGYQVLPKWLKDRRGRVLTPADLDRLAGLLRALEGTIRIVGRLGELG